MVILQIWGCERVDARSHPQIWDFFTEFPRDPLGTHSSRDVVTGKMDPNATEEVIIMLLNQWKLNLDVDHILQGQGADPQIIRQRRPQLVDMAERALEESPDLLDPQLVYEEYGVEDFRHEKISLRDGAVLSGPAIGEHLAPADRVVIMAYTIGPELDRRVASAMRSEPVYALALDGLGTHAVDQLGWLAYQHFEAQAGAQAMQLTMPLSPGMIGWPFEKGQKQLMIMLDSTEAGIQVMDSGQMNPRKSVSAVIGMGKNVQHEEINPCDFCGVQHVCQFRGRHAHR